MKRIVALITLLLVCGTIDAQWLDSNVYDSPLDSVLVQIEQRYSIDLVYEAKNTKGKTVASAPWKFYASAEATLDNVLRPLEMRWNRMPDGSYEIKKWEYFRKPFAEGAAALDELWALYPDRQSWEARKAMLRTHIMSTLGLDGLQKGALNPVKSNLRSHDGYTVENVALEILPGVYVSGSLYMPAKYRGRIPVMLSPHGHFYNKQDNSIPDERGRYRPDQQYRCGMLARMGVAVFSYDMFGWGESAFPLKDHRTDLGLVMQTWQSIRALDWLCAQPWADVSRVGVTGASAGGTQTMLVTALDDRITLSVPVVMTSAHFFGGCPCESGLPTHHPVGATASNNAEFAAMCAPRPLLVISDGQDWTATVPRSEYPYLQKVYGLYGAEAQVSNTHLPDEGHDYGPSKRYAMYDFVARNFGLKATDGHNEGHITIEPAVEMYVFGKDRNLPENCVRTSVELRKLLKQLTE